jgi:pyridoxamine 5'-phosphate oxidase
MKLSDLRKDYTRQALIEAEADLDPLVQFRRWLDEAVARQLPEPNAMTLATSTPEGKPSARVVLLRGFDARGFAFFTNCTSRKGDELAANPWAALVFYWAELERQVRVEGHVEPVSAEESDAYFQARPRGSQLGAWASAQSRVLPDRAALERRVEELSARYGDQPVPRPPYWGGYRVVPSVIEFWQGRPSRLHDRLCYHKQESSGWLRQRLSP